MICINGLWVWVDEYYRMLGAYQAIMKGDIIDVKI
jgi:hypothetical protein